MEDFDKPIIIGVVFDLEVIHNDGSRNINIIRDLLIKEVMDKYNSSIIYVYHPEWSKIPRDQGASTYCLVSYKQPASFSVDLALRDTVELIGSYPENNCKKHIFLFTDRFVSPKNFQYKKAFLSNQIRGYNTKIDIFGIGDQYDKISLKGMVESFGYNFNHADEAKMINLNLMENNGE